MHRSIMVTGHHMALVASSGQAKREEGKIELKRERRREMSGN